MCSAMCWGAVITKLISLHRLDLAGSVIWWSPANREVWHDMQGQPVMHLSKAHQLQ